MANGLVESNDLLAIANAIRKKNGTTNKYKPSEMAAAVLAISGGGTGGETPVLAPLEVTQNGFYVPGDGVDGFSSVTVDVETGGGTGEEPVLAPIEITENGTYTPDAGVDGFSRVTVNVQRNPVLDYLSPTGSQYIKTGIYPSSETKIEIKVRRDAFSDQALFGSRKSSSSSDRFVSFMSESTVAHCQFYNQSYNVDTDDYTGADVVITLSKNGYYYGDTLITTVPQTAFTSSYELYLFALNQANAVNRPISNIRFYYCKIWQNDELVRDYVPVQLGGVVACLYDKVTQKYYFNAGTGDFTAGPVKS